MMTKLVAMREALESDRYFASLIGGPSWAAWRTLLIATMGEKLTEDERTVFRQLTGREEEPGEPCEELTAIMGRRAGKTRAISTLGAYLAACIDYRAVLAPGERGILPILAASTQQAAGAFNFVVGAFAAAPNLAPLVTGKTADTLSLATEIDIAVRPASYRTIRGITAIAAIADEIAFWRSDDTVNPDREILQALGPALATTGGPLIKISSPHARRGELYNTFRRHYGPAGHSLILVAKAPSKAMHPTLRQSVIDRAYEEDPVAAASEYGAEFRTDLEAYVSREAVDQCVIRGRHEAAPHPFFDYTAFVDPSGGSQDAMTMAIAHIEEGIGVLDAVREVKPPFSPASVVADFVQVARAYDCTEITGDHYGSGWVEESFRTAGLRYRAADRSRSELYRELLPQLNSGGVRLLDNPKLITQLCSLERRVARGGRDSIDHPPGGHDDLANAAAGALVSMKSASKRINLLFG